MKSEYFQDPEAELEDEVPILVQTAVHDACTGGLFHAPQPTPPSLSRKTSFRLFLTQAPAHRSVSRGDLHPIGKKLLYFSLRTRVPREAKIPALRLTAMSDIVFAAAAETTMTIAPHIQTSLLENLVRFEILAFERSRAVIRQLHHR